MLAVFYRSPAAISKQFHLILWVIESRSRPSGVEAVIAACSWKRSQGE